MTKEKNVLRARYKQKVKNYFSIKSLSRFDIQKQKKESLKLLCNLRRISFLKDSKIAGYQALPGEPSLHSFYKDYQVAFPVLEEIGMNFYLPSKEGKFKKNKFSILEPHPKESIHWELKDIDVFLIPGTVFDRRGGRIGKGKAYYDRALFQTSAIKIGVAWSFQVHNSLINLESHDVLMDFIVTENFVCIPSLDKNLGFRKLTENFNTAEIDQKDDLKRSF